MSLSGTIGNSGKEKGRTKLFVLFVLALPIFPVRLQASIFGRSELNFRVRNGNGWTLALINTNYFPSKKKVSKENFLKSFSLLTVFFNDKYYIRFSHFVKNFFIKSSFFSL